ncbi:potassium channel family protein [Solimonas marina]|uniref:Potassium channel protein n=1 Tax=Solimonas marina TaxID=2714601 RepID=A0A970B4X3_9GAMM|nr:potassium channel protein [Solimonas marina]NKF20975.1 potassium channel protein [Solimonas marina]
MARNKSSATSRLYIKAPRSPERTLLVRLGLLVALVSMILGIFWWDRDGLRDQIDGHVSFGDVAYFTAVTVATVGYGDIVPVTPRARLVDTVLVTPIRLVIWLIFLGTAYELVLQRWLEARRMSRMQSKMNDHLIICGFGHSGQSAAHEAVARGTPPAAVLVLDVDDARLAAAAECGYIGLRGDATREHDLADAGIERAGAVLICLDRDDSAVLAVLTVRQLNKTVRIVCSVSEEENIKLIRQAGADAIIAPAIVGGYLMADSMQSSLIADYIEDLMRSDGRVRLIERLARADEIGKPMRDIGPGLIVRLHRGEQRIGFWEAEAGIVRAGDRLIEIEPRTTPVHR